MGLTFTEEGHKYESTEAEKIDWISVTSFIGMFKPKFDAKLKLRSLLKTKDPSGMV